MHKCRPRKEEKLSRYDKSIKQMDRKSVQGTKKGVWELMSGLRR